MKHADLTPADHAWLRFYRRRQRQNFGPASFGLRPSSRRAVLEVIRHSAPGAYRVIVAETAAAPPVRVVRQPDTGDARIIEPQWWQEAQCHAVAE